MIFSDIMYVLHHNTTNFCILVIFHPFFTLVSLKVIQIESENEQNPYIWFSMGIDHVAIPIYTVLPYCVIFKPEYPNYKNSIRTCTLQITSSWPY